MPLFKKAPWQRALHVRSLQKKEFRDTRDAWIRMMLENPLSLKPEMVRVWFGFIPRKRQLLTVPGYKFGSEVHFIPSGQMVWKDDLIFSGWVMMRSPQHHFSDKSMEFLIKAMKRDLRRNGHPAKFDSVLIAR